MAGNIRQFISSRPPLFKAALTSGCIMVAGDALAQSVTRQKGEHLRLDFKRMAKFGVVGLTLHGPYFFTGMRTIDHKFGPSRAIGNVFKKTLTSQAVLFPPFVALLFGWVGVLEGKNLQQCGQKIKENYASAFLVGSFFWPAANLINFKFVAPHQRILYVSCAGLVWNTFISWTNARNNQLAIQQI